MRNLFTCLERFVEAAMHKVVVGVDILKEVTSCKVSHAARLPRRVQPVREGVCLTVKRVVILRLVDAHTP